MKQLKNKLNLSLIGAIYLIVCIGVYIRYQNVEYVATEFLTPPKLLLNKSEIDIEQLIYQIKKFTKSNGTSNNEIKEILLKISPSKDGRDIIISTVSSDYQKAEANISEASKLIQNYLTNEVNKTINKKQGVTEKRLELKLKVLELSLTNPKINDYEKVLLKMNQIDLGHDLKEVNMIISESRSIDIHSSNIAQKKDFILIFLLILLGFFPISLWIYIKRKKS